VNLLLLRLKKRVRESKKISKAKQKALGTISSFPSSIRFMYAAKIKKKKKISKRNKERKKESLHQRVGLLAHFFPSLSQIELANSTSPSLCCYVFLSNDYLLDFCVSHSKCNPPHSIAMHSSEIKYILKLKKTAPVLSFARILSNTLSLLWLLFFTRPDF
jgi:hypothetical protein